MAPIEASKHRPLVSRAGVTSAGIRQFGVHSSGFLLLPHFLRLRAFGTDQQIADFMIDEVRKFGAGESTHIQAVTALETLFSKVSQRSSVELSECLESVCSAVRPSVAQVGSIRLNCECETGCEVQGETATSIALIVCETVLNAARYAHPTGVSGRVDVGCRRAGRDLIVEVNDDGVGLPVDFNEETDGQLGFEMVRALARQLGATAQFASDPLGLQFLLRLQE